MDFQVLWTVMNFLDVSQMVLYNCGVHTGSSQGYKHMQIMARPGPEYQMFPDNVHLPPSELVSNELIKSPNSFR